MLFSDLGMREQKNDFVVHCIDRSFLLINSFWIIKIWNNLFLHAMHV